MQGQQRYVALVKAGWRTSFNELLDVCRVSPEEARVLIATEK
jgi:hypothetical protein